MKILLTASVHTMAADNSPFYGIWCQASKDPSEAQYYADMMSGYGFNAQIFTTTDWSHLNPEKWYCVTTGVYAAESDAYNALPSVLSVYSDAYVKYTGNWIGSGSTSFEASVSTSSSVSIPSAEFRLSDGIILLVYNCNEYITLRKAPSFSADILASIPLGAEVSFHASAPDGFYEVEYNGIRGYSASDYLKPIIQIPWQLFWPPSRIPMPFPCIRTVTVVSILRCRQNQRTDHLPVFSGFSGGRKICLLHL